MLDLNLANFFLSSTSFSYLILFSFTKAIISSGSSLNWLSFINSGYSLTITGIQTTYYKRPSIKGKITYSLLIEWHCEIQRLNRFLSPKLNEKGFLRHTLSSLKKGWMALSQICWSLLNPKRLLAARTSMKISGTKSSTLPTKYLIYLSTLLPVYKYSTTFLNTTGDIDWISITLLFYIKSSKEKAKRTSTVSLKLCSNMAANHRHLAVTIALWRKNFFSLTKNVTSERWLKLLNPGDISVWIAAEVNKGLTTSKKIKMLLSPIRDTLDCTFLLSKQWSYIFGQSFHHSSFIKI